jgi:predicted transcriptional regulator
VNIHLSKVKLLLLRHLNNKFETAENIINNVIDEQVFQITNTQDQNLKKLKPITKHETFYTLLIKLFEEGYLDRRRDERLQYRIKSEYNKFVTVVSNLPLLEILKATRKTIDHLDIQILIFCNEKNKLDYTITSKLRMNPKSFNKRAKKLINLKLLDGFDGELGRLYMTTTKGEELINSLKEIDLIDFRLSGVLEEGKV